MARTVSADAGVSTRRGTKLSDIVSGTKSEWSRADSPIASDQDKADEINSGRYFRVDEVVAGLKELRRVGGRLSDNSRLGKAVREILEVEGMETEDQTLDRALKVIDNLPKEVQRSSLRELVEEHDRALDFSGKLDESKIRELDEALSDHMAKGETREQALEAMRREYGLEPVEAGDIIDKYRKAATKVEDQLKAADMVAQVGASKVEEMAEEIASKQVAMAEEMGKEVVVEEKIKVDEAVGKVVEEVVIPAAVEGTLSEEDIAARTEERVREVVGEETSKAISEAVSEETFKMAVKASLDVESGRITEKMVNDLEKTEIGDLVREHRKEVAEIVDEKVKAVITGTVDNLEKSEEVSAVRIVKEVSDKVSRTTGKRISLKQVNSRVSNQVRMESRKIDTILNGFLESRKELVDTIRAERLRGAVWESFEERFTEQNITMTKEVKVSIRDLVKIANVMYNSRSRNGADVDRYKEASVDYVVGRGEVTEGRARAAWDDMRGLVSILKMKPGEFNKLYESYWKTVKKLGTGNLPFEIGEIRSIHQLMQLAGDGGLPVINSVQNMMVWYGRINKFTGGGLTKLGFEKAGQMVLQKIGGQAAAEFSKEALAVLAEKGAVNGVWTVLRQVLFTGGVSAGSTAAEGAVAVGGTGLVAAFQALPVVGQIILVVVLVIVAVVAIYNTVIKPIVNLTKAAISGLLEALGVEISLPGEELNEFLKKNLGNFFGGIADFTIKSIGFFVGMTVLPIAVPIGMVMGVFFATVMLLGLLFMGGPVSSKRPPNQMVGGASQSVGAGAPCKPLDMNLDLPDSCPSVWPSYGPIAQGPNGSYSHTGVEAIDICTPGGDPIYTAHDGIVMCVLDDPDGYGNYVEIQGKCNGQMFSSKYAHMPAEGPMVGVGDTVVTGDQIGIINTTGNSTGDHLHFELTAGIGGIDSFMPGQVYRNCTGNCGVCGYARP